MQQWLAGHKLKNRPYEILKVLGEGAFGITYKVVNLALEVPVVIKTPKNTLKEDDNYSKYLQGFTKEAKQLAKLGMNPHPYVVRVFDYFEEDNLPCIVMEYIEGRTLGDYLRDRGKLPEEEAISLITKIGNALSYLHQNNKLHRDIKPDNIMLRQSNNEPVLIDFGLARELIDDLTYQSMSHTGTPFYAPMEEYDSESKYGAWTDVYALAATLYVLVVGKPQPLFAHIRRYEFAFNKRDPLIPPQEHNSGLSDRINDTILKGLEIEPGDRPQTVKAWLELLEPVEILSNDFKETSDNISESVEADDRDLSLGDISPDNSDSSEDPSTSMNDVSEWLDSLEVNPSLVDADNIREWLDSIGESDDISFKFDESDDISFKFLEDLLDRDLEDKSSTRGNLENNNFKIKNIEFETVKIKEIKVSSGFLGFGKNRKKVILSREKKRTTYFTEDLSNGITLEMLEIPGGTFIMGSPEDELKRYKDESPQHEVSVPRFYMAKFQVTQAQWKAVAAMPQVERKLKPDPSYFKGDNLPVEQVTWYDAVEFCKRLSKATGKEYRLPSEAEWEYACRGGTTTPFHFGETITTELVNYNGNYTYGNAPKGEYRATTIKVGSFPPNEFGLYDMHGNVWEWCGDTYQESYQGAPSDGSAWISRNGSTYMLRGGSWYFSPRFCRSAYRDWNAPDLDYRVGFRCVAGNFSQQSTVNSQQ